MQWVLSFESTSLSLLCFSCSTYAFVMTNSSRRSSLKVILHYSPSFSRQLLCMSRLHSGRQKMRLRPMATMAKAAAGRARRIGRRRIHVPLSERERSYIPMPPPLPKHYTRRNCLLHINIKVTQCEYIAGSWGIL